MDDSICIFFGVSSSSKCNSFTALGLVPINLRKVIELDSQTVCLNRRLLSGSLRRRVVFKSGCKKKTRLVILVSLEIVLGVSCDHNVLSQWKT